VRHVDVLANRSQAAFQEGPAVPTDDDKGDERKV
jgi:hypothetical protein